MFCQDDRNYFFHSLKNKRYNEIDPGGQSFSTGGEVLWQRRRVCPKSSCLVVSSADITALTAVSTGTRMTATAMADSGVRGIPRTTIRERGRGACPTSKQHQAEGPLPSASRGG